MASTNIRQCLAIHAMSYSSKCLLHARRRLFDSQPLNLYAGTERSNHRKHKHKHKHLVEEAHRPDGEFTRAISPESVRHVQSQQIGYQQQQYDTGFLYGFDQSETTQMTYGISLPENLGGLPSSGARFGVPQQYFPSADDTENVSQYLSTQEQLAAEYQHQQRSPLNRRIDSSTMSSFNPTGSMGNMQPQAAQNMTNLEDAYNQYRQGLITVFGYTQRGHLNEASRLLLDLSAWLIDNARDL
ncbi:hypothetical protein F66182_15611, partial [Fusarium sp. NRRL 66182]